MATSPESITPSGVYLAFAGALGGDINLVTVSGGGHGPAREITVGTGGVLNVVRPDGVAVALVLRDGQRESLQIAKLIAADSTVADILVKW
jgi:hypothetical protein